MGSLMQTILQGFSPGGIQGYQARKQQLSAAQQDQQIQEQQARQRAEQLDNDAYAHAMAEGYLPVGPGGVVRRPYFPGAQVTNSGAAPTGEGPTGEDTGGSASAPGGQPGGTYIDKADPSRVIKHTDANGDVVQWEIPTPEEQFARRKQLRAEQDYADAMSARAKAEGTAAGTETGRQSSLNTARQNYGVALPPGSGVAEGQKFLPEELPGVVSGVTQATSLPAMIQQAQLARASQSLGAVTTPGAYKILYNQLSPDLQQRFDSPEDFDPIKSPTRARMVSMKPEDQQKTSLMLNMAPSDWDAQTDAAYPITGANANEKTATAAQNRSAKMLVQSYVRRGEFDKANAIIEKGNEQQGKTITAVAGARATEGPKIYTAGAIEAAKNAADAAGLNNPDGTPDPVAAAIANYQQPPLSSFAMARPGGRALMAAVMKINPAYDAKNYVTAQRTENDAATGKIATSTRALNTMMGHLSTLNQAADALKNSDIQALNKLANGLGAQTGSSAPTVYDTIVHRLGPEVTKAYIAGGGTAEERGTNEKDFSRNLGPDQIKANIGVSAQLADSLIKALQDQYNGGTYGRGKRKLISDEAEAARQRLTGQSPVHTQATISTPSTQAEFDALPKGAQFRKPNDSKVYMKQ